MPRRVLARVRTRRMGLGNGMVHGIYIHMFPIHITDHWARLVGPGLCDTRSQLRQGPR